MENNTLIKILMADGCTKREAERFINRYTDVYENTDDYKKGYIENCIGGGFEYEEAVEMWDELSQVTVDGTQYKIDYAL